MKCMCMCVFVFFLCMNREENNFLLCRLFVIYKIHSNVTTPKAHVKQNEWKIIFQFLVCSQLVDVFFFFFASLFLFFRHKWTAHRLKLYLIWFLIIVCWFIFFLYWLHGFYKITLNWSFSNALVLRISAL